MVRIINKRLQDDDINYYEFSGTHSDTKPTSNIATGSVFLEVDTGSVFFFEEEQGDWVEVGGSDE